jgi:hypothetical protein
MRENRNVCEILDGKRPLGRPRREWENIKTDLEETGLEVIDWINVASNSRKFWEFLE